MDARLRSSQPTHVSAYLTYALCDLRQLKRRSTTFQQIGQNTDGTGGATNQVVGLLESVFQQALKYVESLDSAWFGSLSRIPDLEGLLRVAYELVQSAASATFESVKIVVTKFFGLAQEALGVLGEGVAQAVAQLTVNMTDFLTKFAQTFVSAILPLVQLTIRVVVAAYGKFAQLVKAFGTLAAHVIDSLAVAGVDAATETLFFIFTAAMEIPKMASAGKEEVIRYLQGIALNANARTLSFIPYEWNAAQWVLEIEWVSRLAYYLQVGIGRIAVFMEKVVLYLSQALRAMRRLVLTYFGEVFSQLGHRTLNMINPIMEPIVDFFQVDKKETADTLSVSIGNLKVSLEGADDLLTASKQGEIQLSDAAKIRLSDSMDTIRTFMRELEEAKHQRNVALIKRPGALLERIANRSRFLKRIYYANTKSDIEESGIQEHADQLLQEEIGLTLVDFNQRYGTMQSQIQSAIVLAMFELQATSPSPPSPQKEGLRRRRPVQNVPLEGRVFGDEPIEESNIEIIELRAKIAALDSLIANITESEEYRSTSNILTGLKSNEILAMRPKILRAMTQIQTEALSQSNKLGYYVGLQKEYEADLRKLERGVRSKLRNINWWSVGVTMAVIAAFALWYYIRHQRQKEVAITRQAAAKDAEFQKWTKNDPFVIEMTTRWRNKGDKIYTISETDPARGIASRIDAFRDHLRQEIADLSDIDPENKDQMKTAHKLGMAVWDSIQKDADIASQRHTELMNSKTWFPMRVYTYFMGKDTPQTYEDTVHRNALRIKARCDDFLKVASPAQVAELDATALPSSYAGLLTKDFTWDKFRDGPSAYVVALEKQKNELALKDDSWGTWFLNSIAQENAKDSASVPKLGNKQFITHLGKLLTWRVETIGTSLDLYRGVLTADQSYAYQVLNYIADTTKQVVSDVAYVSGLTNVNMTQALDIEGGAFQALADAVGSANPLNYIKLFAFYRWVGVTAALFFWLVGGLIYLTVSFVVAWVANELDLAVSRFKEMGSYWLSTLGILVAQSSIYAFAYWQSRVASLGLIFQIVEFIYFKWYVTIYKTGSVVVGWPFRALKAGGTFAYQGFLNLFTKSQDANLNYPPIQLHGGGPRYETSASFRVPTQKMKAQ